MAKVVCLILLTVAGVALTALPEGFFHFVNGSAQEPLRLWLSSLKAFAVPFCLLVLSATKQPVIRYATLGWALWLTGLSLNLTANIQRLAPATTFYGEIFLATILVLSLSLTLSAAIQISSAFPVKEKVDPPPSDGKVGETHNASTGATK